MSNESNPKINAYNGLKLWILLCLTAGVSPFLIFRENDAKDFKPGAVIIIRRNVSTQRNGTRKALQTTADLLVSRQE